MAPNNQSNFYAIVGAPGSGKDELFKSLQDLHRGNLQYVFITDSGNNESHFLNCLNGIAKNGHHKTTSPLTQLAFFWSRLSHVIETEVQKHLAEGKKVIIAGFGGTVLSHALCGVRREAEKERIINLHKAFIQACVIGSNVPPPVYLWLQANTEVAIERLKSNNLSPNVMDMRAYVEELNQLFDFYGSLPGQMVVKVNANNHLKQVFQDTLHIITPENQFVTA